jgi:sialidase-1
MMICQMVKNGLFLLCGLMAALPGLALEQVEVFVSGEGGYHTYRIPALIATKKGTLLAFCEGRKNSGGDSGDIDVVLKRSFDNGRTWSAMQKIADFGEDTIGNPTPVVERKTGAILLLLTRNPGEQHEKQIIDRTSAGTRTVWISRSTDDGATWSAPAEITASTKLLDWTWYATGPGNGIQTRSGRLVIPCDHNTGDKLRYSHVIYSDDRGATWKIGGVAEEKTNESAVAEARDGSLVFNMRSYHGKSRRAVARSRDGGLTWSPLALDEALVEPVCQASLISAARPGKRPDGRLLFSNPAATTRTRMTVRFSRDDGRTWAGTRVIHEGPAAYSSLAVRRDGSIGLLYERGSKRPYEKITFASFDVGWVAAGK